jgi:acyl CoA:acetate/3-ketoacid CoA transferase alpha subunit
LVDRMSQGVSGHCKCKNDLKTYRKIYLPMQSVNLDVAFILQNEADNAATCYFANADAISTMDVSIDDAAVRFCQ